LLPGSRFDSALSQPSPWAIIPAHLPATLARIDFEVATGGMPLWMYQPPSIY
jgi:hypothetical protein